MTKAMTKEQARRNVLLGKYLQNPKLKQATGRLRKEGNKKCCLGHGCDLFRKITGLGKWRRDRDGDWEFIVGEHRNASLAPRPVGEFFGWDVDSDDESNPPLTVALMAEETDAAELNDEIKLALPAIGLGFIDLGKKRLARIKQAAARKKGK